MTRSEFIVSLHKFITQHSSRWLPEEATAELFLTLLSKHLDRHADGIVEILNGRRDNRNPHKTDSGSFV